MDSDATVCRRWRSCVRRFPLHLIGPRCPPAFPRLRGCASPPAWPPGVASQTDTKWRRLPPNSRLPKRSRLPTKFYQWSIAASIFGTVLQSAFSKQQSCHCLRHFFLELNSTAYNKAIFMPFYCYRELRSGYGASSGDEVSRCVHVCCRICIIIITEEEGNNFT